MRKKSRRLQSSRGSKMPLFSPVTGVLKNGKSVTIRSVEPKDIEPYLAAVRASIEQNDGQVMEPGEWSKTPEQMLKWISEVEASPSDLLLLAECEGQILGDLNVKAGNRKRVAHTCEFGISIIPGARGLGVGEALMRALIDWAKKHPKIEKINLRVLSNNSPALALYKKMGFTQDGCKKGEIKLSATQYVDDLNMSLWVKN